MLFSWFLKVKACPIQLTKVSFENRPQVKSGSLKKKMLTGAQKLMDRRY